MILDSLREFFIKYYVVPGYDWVDTITYGIILGLCVFYLLPKLNKLGFEIDSLFVKALAPYAFLGATARELVDQALGWYANHSVYPANFYLVSPTIYLTMFLFTVFWLIFSIQIGKYLKKDYRIIFGVIGCFFAGYNFVLILTNIQNVNALALVLLSFIIASIGTYFIIKFGKFGFILREGNYLVMASHLFDASTTFVGVDFLGHVEQHVVPNIFIDFTGTSAVMFPLKIIVLIPALYYIDKDLKDEKFNRRLFKIVIAILGLGPGLRNMTLMLLG